MMKIIMKRSHTFVSLLGVSAAVLSFEAWLQFQDGASLCRSSACRAVAEYVRIGEPVLVLFGALFFWSVFGLALCSVLTKKHWVWNLVGVSLFGALAFDGALLGYQFVGLGQRCHLCLGVGIALGVIVLMYGLVHRSWLMPLIGVAVFVSGFTANSILKVSPDLPRLEETAFVSIPARNVDSRLTLHLFFSFHCSHCFKVLADLSVNEPWLANWYLSTYDQDTEDLYRLSKIRSELKGSVNPFQVIVDVERLEEVEAMQVADDLRDAVEKAETYFHHSDFKGIPTLIAEEGPGRRIVSVGRNNIMHYLASRGLITRVLRFEDEVEQRTSKEKTEKSS